MDNWFSKQNCDRCGRFLSGSRIMSMYNEDCLCMSCKESEMQRPDYAEVSRKDAISYLHRNGVPTEMTVYNLSGNPAIKLYELSYNQTTLGYRFKICMHTGSERIYDMSTSTFNECLTSFAFAPPVSKILLKQKGNVLVSDEELAAKRNITELKTVGEFTMVLKRFTLI